MTLKPGQQICQISKQSAINKEYSEFNKEQINTVMGSSVTNEHYKKVQTEDEHGILVEFVKQVNKKELHEHDTSKKRN